MLGKSSLIENCLGCHQSVTYTRPISSKRLAVPILDDVAGTMCFAFTFDNVSFGRRVYIQKLQAAAYSLSPCMRLKAEV